MKKIKKKGLTTTPPNVINQEVNEMEKFDLFNLKFNGYLMSELYKLTKGYRVLCEFEWIAEKHPELSQDQVFDIALEVADRFEDLEFGQEENDIIWDAFRERGLKW